MRSIRSMIIAVTFALLALGSCATVAVYNPSDPSVTIARATPAEIANFGPSFETNPYMEPRTILRGKLNEFVVIKVALNLQKDSRISIIADASTAADPSVAIANDKVALTDYWNFLSGGEAETPKARKRLSTIDITCIPSLNFTQKAGKSTYYIPFVGKNPIPRPAKIYVQVSAGSGEPAVYTATLE